jgi:hypothetical protein
LTPKSVRLETEEAMEPQQQQQQQKVLELLGYREILGA